MNDQETMPLFAGTELTDDNGAPAEKELEKVSGLNNSSKEDSSGYSDSSRRILQQQYRGAQGPRDAL